VNGRGWIAIGVRVVAVGMVAWWWRRRDDRDDRAARRFTRSALLDVEAFRAQHAVRLQRAKEIAARSARQSDDLRVARSPPERGLHDERTRHVLRGRCGAGDCRARDRVRRRMGTRSGLLTAEANSPISAASLAGQSARAPTSYFKENSARSSIRIASCVSQIGHTLPHFCVAAFTLLSRGS
jgi:hypothetical protein